MTDGPRDLGYKEGPEKQVHEKEPGERLAVEEYISLVMVLSESVSVDGKHKGEVRMKTVMET
jgi:hypothetical protein